MPHLMGTNFIVPDNPRWEIHYVEGDFVVQKRIQPINPFEKNPRHKIYGEYVRLDLAVKRLVAECAIFEFDESYILQLAEVFFRSMQIPVERDKYC